MVESVLGRCRSTAGSGAGDDEGSEGARGFRLRRFWVWRIWVRVEGFGERLKGSGGAGEGLKILTAVTSSSVIYGMILNNR